MNEIPSPETNSTPCVVAKFSWQLWAVAIGIIIFTHSLSFKVAAETVALLLVCGGFLLGIVMLATISKFGKQGILKHALLGVALNGLMLSIAIPNFINARNAAIQKNEAMLKSPVSTENWAEYKIAGLQFVSPVELKTFSLSTDEANTNLQTYMGQIVPPGVTVFLHRRHLTSDDEYTLENFTSQVVDLMKQKFPESFQSRIQDITIDGNPSKQISAGWEKQGMKFKDSVLVIQKQPYIWQVQVLLPGQIPNGDEVTKKVFDSIKILPQKN